MGYYLGAEDYYTHMVGGGYDLHRDKTAKCGAGCSEIEWSAQGIYSTEVFAAELVAKIRSHASTAPSKPLFVYAAFQSVHSPIEAPAWVIFTIKCIILSFIDFNKHFHIKNL
jgi:arylsulfatase B